MTYKQREAALLVCQQFFTNTFCHHTEIITIHEDGRADRTNLPVMLNSSVDTGMKIE